MVTSSVPVSMYPVLHCLEDRGLLVSKSKEKQEGRRYRRFYEATSAGRQALVAAKEKVRELFEHQPDKASRNQRKRPKT
jgi:PadR family transcriptional regulator, regulatory protein PadR